MKKILCPTDFSPSAVNAVGYAAKLTQKTSAMLTLFNVQSVLELTPGEALMGKRYNMNEAERALNEASEEVRRVFRISCDAIVTAAETSIASAISEYGVGHDLIVMGTNGPDDMFQFVLGSNAYRTIRKSSVPVLFVPERAGYQEIKTILYAFDLLEAVPPQVTQAMQFAKAVGSSIDFVQVNESFKREQEVKLAHLTESIKEMYGEGPALSFKTVFSSDIVQALDLQMKESGYDLMALCSIHRNLIDRLFHKSVIHALSKGTTYPVLIFHS